MQKGGRQSCLVFFGLGLYFGIFYIEEVLAGFFPIGVFPGYILCYLLWFVFFQKILIIVILLSGLIIITISEL